MRNLFIILLGVTFYYFVKSAKVKTVQRSTTIIDDDCTFGYYFNGSACEKCGLAKVSPRFRIVSGVKAVRNSIPSYVFVTSDTGFCEGTLINRRTVITAAHCIKTDFTPTPEYPTLESAYSIAITQYNSSDWIETNKYKISKLIRHPLYNVNNSYLYDIAVMILETPIKPSKLVYPACLPPKSDKYPKYNTSAFIAGWGITAQGGSMPDDLMNVNVTVYDPVKCDSSAHKQLKEYYKSALCAGDLKTGNGACFGDSGGSLYTTQKVNGQKVYVATGIASYLSAACGTPGWPQHYTRVAHYIDWIKSYWEY